MLKFHWCFDAARSHDSKDCFHFLYNVEAGSFRQIQEVQRVIQMTAVLALPCNQMHENSHIPPCVPLR